MVGRPELALAAVLNAAVDGGQKSVDDWAHAMLDDLRTTISIQGPPRSQPWDPPHVETGYLLRSYSVDVSSGRPVITVSMSTYAYYAHYLEFGTRHMAARPHFRPAVARWKPLLVPMLAKGIISAEKAMARRYGGSG
jgi:HK97 gp10 family phage protein